MKPALALLLLSLAAALAFLASPAYAQIELTESDPPDGATLAEPPDRFHLCFSQPLRDDFNFNLRLPDGRRAGLSIVFRPTSQCVDIVPLLPDDAPAGEYTFDWQVKAAEGDEEDSGTISLQVTEGRRPTPSASPAPGETPPPVTPSPEGSPEAGDAGDDDGPDILFLALITTASLGGAAVLFTLGHLLRRRIGYEPHRPPEGGEEGEDH